jgi:hypothetical protein
MIRAPVAAAGNTRNAAVFDIKKIAAYAFNTRATGLFGIKNTLKH